MHSLMGSVIKIRRISIFPPSNFRYIVPVTAIPYAASTSSSTSSTSSTSTTTTVSPLSHEEIPNALELDNPNPNPNFNPRSVLLFRKLDQHSRHCRRFRRWGSRRHRNPRLCHLQIQNTSEKHPAPRAHRFQFVRRYPPDATSVRSKTSVR
jgi:hypothetical protein